MENYSTLIHCLETKNDLEWFDAICNILKKNQNPTVHLMSAILGVEKPNPKDEIHGSKLLEPFDIRFNVIHINPILYQYDIDKPIEYLCFEGKNFKLKASDIIDRFLSFQTKINTYDGGIQFFFYPISREYEFTALDFWTQKDPEEIENKRDLIFNNLTFRFGNRLIEGMDGYGMKR